MFEIVYETRKAGVSPDDPSPPLTSLVLESKFETAEKATDAIKGFQAPYANRWNDSAQGWYFASEGDDGQYEFWYVRPVAD